MDSLSLYNEAQDALESFRKQKDRYIDTIAKITLAEINLDSVRASVAKKLDAIEKISKTALKDRIDGDELVMESKHKLLKLKTNKEALSKTMEYLDKVYSLKKKMMGSLDVDKQQFGG